MGLNASGPKNNKEKFGFIFRQRLGSSRLVPWPRGLFSPHLGEIVGYNDCCHSSCHLLHFWSNLWSRRILDPFQPIQSRRTAPNSSKMGEDRATTTKQKNGKMESSLRLVRNPYQTCPEVLFLLRTQTKQLKWTSKRKRLAAKAVRKMGCAGSAPEPWPPGPATGHSPRILCRTAFAIDFWCFEVHFSCFVWVLRRDSISEHT